MPIFKSDRRRRKKKRMRVLFIINQLGGGGAERVLTLIANHMSDDNEVYILSFSPNVSKYPIDEKIVINEVHLNKKSAINVSKEIRKYVKKIKPDCFISFEYHMNMKALLGTIGYNGVYKIISERNDPAHKGGRSGQKQIRELLYRFADVLVCQTPDAKAYFPKSIQKKTVVIANPVTDKLPERWEGCREKKVVNFCRLEKQKNIPLLIEAFEQFQKTHADYVLNIYGNGNERENIEQFITERKLDECVKLFPATEDIHNKIRKAAMFVSTSDYEGLSNSMLEAMALGIPTICTDCPCGGARMVIENGKNGFLSPVNDKNDISGKMSLIADNNAVAERIGKESVKIREAYSVKVIIRQWLSVINRREKR